MLYAVEVKYVMVVNADSETEAEEIATSAITSGDVYGEQDVEFVYPIQSFEDLPLECDPDTLPWGKGPDVTIRQILERKMVESACKDSQLVLECSGNEGIIESGD